jgi:hypothetical protein
MGVREEQRKIDEERRANASNRKAKVNQTIKDQQARQRGYGNRGGSTYRTPAEQKAHLENMRKAQAAGAQAGPRTGGGERMSANEGADRVNEAKRSAQAGTQAPAEETGKSGKNPTIRERASQKVGATRDAVNAKREQVQQSKTYQGAKDRAGKIVKGTGRGIGKVAGGAYRAGAGTVRVGVAGLTSPAAWAATGAAYGYRKGRQHTADRAESGEFLRDQFGGAAPSRGEMQPFDAPFTEKISTYLNDQGRNLAAVADRHKLGSTTVGARGMFSGIRVPTLTEQGAPDISGMSPVEGARVYGEWMEQQKLNASSSEDLFREDQIRNEATLGDLRSRTNTVGEAAVGQADLNLIGQRMVADGYVDALNSPKTTPEMRREIYMDITRGLASRGVGGEAVNQFLFDQGVDPDFLQQVAEEVDPRNVPLVGYDESGYPTRVYGSEADNFIEVRPPLIDLYGNPIEDTSGRGASTGGIRSFQDDLGPTAEFTDLNARGSEGFREGSYIPRSAEENEGNRQMRERLIANTPERMIEGELDQQFARSIRSNLAELDQLAADGKIKLIGGRRQALDFASKLDTPQGRRELDLMVETKKSSDRKLPEMSGAELAALPLRERLGRIQDQRTAAQELMAEEMNSPRWQRQIDQLADPNNTLRKAARTSQVAAQDWQDARNEAEETLTKRLEQKYSIDISPQLEGTAIERREAEDYVLSRGARNAALKEFDEQITAIAGDNVAVRNAMSSMARKSGITELVANGQLSTPEAEYQAANLYALDKMLRTFSRKTGKTVGVDVVQTFNEGGMPAVRDLFRSQFVEGGGGFYFDDPSLRGILDGSEREAVVDRFQSTISGGLFGDSGVGTMILRGPEGERISVKELLGDDPFMYETFINMIQDAQEQ